MGMGAEADTDGEKSVLNKEADVGERRGESGRWGESGLAGERGVTAEERGTPTPSSCCSR